MRVFTGPTETYKVRYPLCLGQGVSRFTFPESLFPLSSLPLLILTEAQEVNK